MSYEWRKIKIHTYALEEHSIGPFCGSSMRGSTKPYVTGELKLNSKKGRVYIKSSVGALVLDITIVRYG